MKLNPFILRSLFAKPIQTPSILHKCFSFSTTNHPTKSSSHYFDDVVPGTSSVYNHALKFQRPATIRWKPWLENSASFIGSVAREVKHVNSKIGDFGVYTTLRVQKPDRSPFWVLLMMWNNVAEIAYEHLKPNDLICVSGYLDSFDGNSELCYKLNVKELNFVARSLGYEDHEKEHKFEGAKAGNQNYGNPLHLWQVFFANPNEWWDQRKNKLNPKQPDFKHKDTGEALWLSKHNPPWVTKQLKLLDSKFSEGGFAGRRSRVTSWVYDE